MARKKASGKKGSKSAKGRAGEKAGKPGKRGPKRPSIDLVNYRRMHALSKEERVRIFAILCERIASPKEISEELDEGLSHVSYHVSVLRECRLIVEDHKVPRRGAIEHFYRAAAPTLIPPNAWDHLPPAVRRGISVSILQEFFDDASASMEAGVFDESPGELSWTPLILDALGVEEFGQLARDFLQSVLELQANASNRLPRGNDKATNATSATVFLACFLSTRSPEDGKKASAAKRR
ncbi:MAG TPA: winged helix-turn-helix domain-containing protein [Solirubrobacterales bacterium]|nr:winged helix-turn-helix domain-containing protein [Solirubrobacterales bacterium]